MNKLQRLKACDYCLLATTAIMLSSSIQLEITSGQYTAWVWIHIFLGVIFFSLIGWHLQLHFRWRDRLRQLCRQKPATKWLTVIGLLTLLTAITATCGWIASPAHSVIGAIHGKLGFLFIILTIGHIAHQRKFFHKN